MAARSAKGMTLSSATDRVVDSQSQELPGVSARPVVKFLDDRLTPTPDEMIVEEPLEIIIGGLPYAVTMRMPGDDLHLAAGFCLSEGLVSRPEDLASISPCPHDPNKLTIELSLSTTGTPERERGGEFLSRSSCGLCGRDRLDEIFTDIAPVTSRNIVSASVIQRWKADFESRKVVFPLTGGAHSAAVYRLDGVCLGFAEDVGRHNALDKAAGQVLLKGAKEEAYLALVSSRLSFEMVQKAAALGVQVLAGVSAATTLAAEYAQRMGLTLIGFLRRGRMNIYTVPERIQ
jgi:FdhD protein